MLTIYHISIILQITGVLFASFFGSILLAPEFTGKFAKWLELCFVRVATKLRGNIIKITPVVITLAPILSPGLTYAFFWVISVTLLILGQLLEVPIIFWIGVALSSYYALVSLGALITLAVKLAKEKTTKGRLLLRLLVTALLLFVIGWFIWLSVALVLVLIGMSLAVTQILARPETPKRGFVIIGSIVLLVGLILELIASYL